MSRGKCISTKCFSPIRSLYCWLQATSLAKNSIEMEKKKNVGGKAKQKKTKSCIKQLISIDCIQLCKRC